MPDFNSNGADPSYDSLAGLLDAIGSGLQHLTDGAQHAIDDLVHKAAVGLLNSALPPMVHGHNALVRSGAWHRVEALTAQAAVSLTDARFRNGVLAGAVSTAVEAGIERITSELDYAKAVDTIT